MIELVTSNGDLYLIYDAQLYPLKQIGQNIANQPNIISINEFPT